MKQLLIIACVLLTGFFARSQPLEDLVEDVQAHRTSLTALMALFSKHPSYINETNYTYNEALLGERMEKADFHYTLADSIVRRMYVRVIYKNNQVHYIKVEGMRYDSTQKRETWQTAYRYVDTAYTSQVLGAYNSKHQTHFTWKDLYEDSCREFAVGIFWGSDYEDSAFDAKGHFRREIYISRPVKQAFYPLVKKRDHNAILTNCLSFNPVRKAYGAVCLYAMQQLGEPLTKTEKHLLRQCRRCREKIKYMDGDRGSFVKIRALLGSNKLMREQCHPLILPRQKDSFAS